MKVQYYMPVTLPDVSNSEIKKNTAGSGQINKRNP
jgi:hypothetical protein